MRIKKFMYHDDDFMVLADIKMPTKRFKNRNVIAWFLRDNGLNPDLADRFNKLDDYWHLKLKGVYRKFFAENDKKVEMENGVILIYGSPAWGDDLKKLRRSYHEAKSRSANSNLNNKKMETFFFEVEPYFDDVLNQIFYVLHVEGNNYLNNDLWKQIDDLNDKLEKIFDY